MARAVPRLRRALGAWRRLAASRSGAGALEFAFTAPVLVLLLCAGFEVSRYVKAVREISAASTAVAGMIAQSTTAVVNDTDLLFYRDAIMIAYPDVMTNAAAAKKTPWTSDIGVTMSSVSFNPTQKNCTANCTYQATVDWSGGSYPRPCSTYLTSTADNAQPSTTTLPADAFGPGSLIVIDLVYNYRPIIASRFLGAMTLKRSFYVQPRYVNAVAYSASGTNYATNCPSS